MKITDKQADIIADTMREILEATENNMITRANQALVKRERPSIPQLRRELNTSLKLQAQILSRAEEITGANLKRLRDEMVKSGNLLISSTMKYVDRANANIVRMERSMPLREAIFKQTQLGIDTGLKITYKNGRNYGYKEYMEMNTRTTVQQEIGALQLASGGNAGIVFYVANVFQDCADDHADYQGKIYYDDRWRGFGYSDEDTTKIEKLIKNMLSVQDVREKPPYLTTRPNCRHSLTPISIEQAGGNTQSLIRDLKLSTGSYREGNYEALQQQRYNERQIRFYKNRLEHNKALGDIVPSDVIHRDKFLVSKWQQEQRNLIKKYDDVLERDYRRETRKILVQDLGVRYNLK